MDAGTEPAWTNSRCPVGRVPHTYQAKRHSSPQLNRYWLYLRSNKAMGFRFAATHPTAKQSYGSADPHTRESTQNTEYTQQPQNHRDDHHNVQYLLDAPIHRNITVD